MVAEAEEALNRSAGPNNATPTATPATSDEVSSLTETVANLESELTTAKGKIGALQLYTTTLKSEKSDLQSRIDGLESSLTTSQETRADTASKLTDATSEKRSLALSLEKADSKIKFLTKRIEQSSQKVNEDLSSQQSLIIELADARLLLQQRDEETNILNVHMADAATTTKELEKQVSGLKSQVDELRSSLVVESKECDKLNEEKGKLMKIIEEKNAIPTVSKERVEMVSVGVDTMPVVLMKEEKVEMVSVAVETTPATANDSHKVDMISVSVEAIPSAENEKNVTMVDVGVETITTTPTTTVEKDAITRVDSSVNTDPAVKVAMVSVGVETIPIDSTAQTTPTPTPTRTPTTPMTSAVGINTDPISSAPTASKGVNTDPPAGEPTTQSVGSETNPITVTTAATNTLSLFSLATTSIGTNTDLPFSTTTDVTIARLNETIDELKSSREMISVKLASAEDLVLTLNTTIAQLKISAEKDAAVLKAQIQTLRTEIVAVNSQKAELLSIVNNNENATSASLISALEEKRTAHSRIEMLNQQIAELTTIKTATIASVEEKERELSNAVAEKKVSDEIAAAKSEELAAKSTEIATLRQNIADLASRETTASAGSIDLARSLQNLLAEKKISDQSAATKSADLAEYSAELAAKTVEITTLRQKITDLNAAANATNTELNALRHENIELAASTKATDSKLEYILAEKEKSDENAALSLATTAQLQERVRAAEKTLQEHKDAAFCNDDDTTLLATIESKNKAEAALATAEKKNSSLKKISEENATLQEELALARKKLSEAEQLSTREIAKLEDRLKLVCEMVETMKKESSYGAATVNSTTAAITPAGIVPSTPTTTTPALMMSGPTTPASPTILVTEHEEEIKNLTKSVAKQYQAERDLFARKLHAKLQAEHVSKISLLHHKHAKEVELIRSEAKQTQEHARKILLTAKKEVESGIRKGLEKGESAEVALVAKKMEREKEEEVLSVRSKYRRRIQAMREEWEEEKRKIMDVVQNECDIILRKSRTYRDGEGDGDGDDDESYRKSSSRDDSRVMSIEETDHFIQMVLESCRK